MYIYEGMEGDKNGLELILIPKICLKSILQIIG